MNANLVQMRSLLNNQRSSSNGIASNLKKGPLCKLCVTGFHSDVELTSSDSILTVEQ